MIGLDTNVLVRYFAQDHPTQSAKATELIEHRLTEDDPGFISLVALAEAVWVLRRTYGLTAFDVGEIVERLLRAPVLVVESEAEVFRALAAFRAGHASFADALIAAVGDKAGCSATFTFDRKASRLPGFALLS